MATLLGRNRWEPLPESGEIELSKLSTDVERLIVLIDTMGTAMKPVRSDVVGNMTKIIDSRDKQCPNVECLRELLETEVASGSHKKDPSACVGILWLYRGLQFFFRFLELMYEHKDEASDSCQAHVSKAYDETLRPLHNFVVRGVFNVVSHAAPRKSTVILRLMENDPSKEEVFYKEFEEFISSMKPTLDAIKQLIEKLDLK